MEGRKGVGKTVRTGGRVEDRGSPPLSVAISRQKVHNTIFRFVCFQMKLALNSGPSRYVLRLRTDL